MGTGPPCRVGQANLQRRKQRVGYVPLVSWSRHGRACQEGTQCFDGGIKVDPEAESKRV